MWSQPEEAAEPTAVCGEGLGGAPAVSATRSRVEVDKGAAPEVMAGQRATATTREVQHPAATRVCKGTVDRGVV